MQGRSDENGTMRENVVTKLSVCKKDRIIFNVFVHKFIAFVPLNESTREAEFYYI